MKRKKLVRIPGPFIWNDQRDWLKKQPDKINALIRDALDFFIKSKEKEK